MKVAMILAAGRGERLHQLTNSTPKALCLVKGKPLIEYHLHNLSKAGFTRIIINHAYLGGQIRNHLGDGSRFGVELCYSAEPPGGLETGGGVVNALPLIGDKPFLVVNADIFTDFDFNVHNVHEVQSIHLILVAKNPALGHPGDFGLEQDMRLSNTHREYTFACIGYYHPQIFSSCKYGRYSLTPLIREQVESKNVTGSVHKGVWFDIGSMERLEAANKG